jgi:cytoskeleton protein RodZ
MTNNDRVRGPTGSERLVAQQRKRGRLFNLSAQPENDLSERMMIGASPKSIGADLRAAREARGESTADVAHQLRLRESYIDAIETGNFDALPGVTYAIGFLRSYARYLRLDADDLIQRFKEEVSDIPPPADLAFLEPVSESRVPRGGLVGLAILLAVAAYGGWYYLSTRDMTVADLVPAVPDQFANLVSPTDKSEPQSTTTAPNVAEAPAADAGAATPAIDGTVDESTPAPEQLGAAPATPATPNSTAATPPTAPAPPSMAPAKPAAPPNAATSQAAIPPVPAVPNTDGATHAPTGSDGSASARVYGEGNTGSRITVRADGDSWIQVRAADETLLMTRTLRAGDSYRVPNQPGLRLMTGSAGALEIFVDGQPTPSLGAVGQVKRNILLDPERLKAGGAAN